MSWKTDEMECSDNESDCDFEVIRLDPRVLYESDDSSENEQVINLSPVKQEKQPEVVTNFSVDVEEKNVVEEPKPVEKTEIPKAASVVHKIEEASCDSIADENSNDSMSSPKKVRKKLNYQEYKMRRANEPDKPLFDVPRKIAAFELCDVPASLPLLLLPTDPAWIASNKKSLAQESENISSWSSASYNPAVYEEITIVSMGCNTEISIPPLEDSENMADQPASKFLTSIVNNLNRNNVESLLNSSTSLFSSIQAVVQGKCVSTKTESDLQAEDTKDTNEHGEDKIIMHLRKDRLRPLRCTIGTQTNNVSLFPPLLLTPCLVNSNRARKVRSYRRKISRSRSRSRSFSPSMDYDRVRYTNNNNRYSRSQHSTHSSSMNSSESSSSSSSDSDSDDSSCTSSSDSLKRFNDKQNFRFYNNRHQSNQGYTKYQGKFNSRDY